MISTKHTVDVLRYAYGYIEDGFNGHGLSAEVKLGVLEVLDKLDSLIDECECEIVNEYKADKSD